MGRGSRKSSSSQTSWKLDPKEKIKVWLDDDLIDRAAPKGWIHVTTADEAIELLKTKQVVELSLDHDLGDDELYGRGVDVVDFLCESAFHENPHWPKKIKLHTANPYGRDTMLRSLQKYNPAYKLSYLNSQPILQEENEKS